MGNVISQFHGFKVHIFFTTCFLENNWWFLSRVAESVPFVPKGHWEVAKTNNVFSWTVHLIIHSNAELKDQLGNADHSYRTREWPKEPFVSRGFITNWISSAGEMSSS